MNKSIIDTIIARKVPCYFISPHLDDAVFSAGALMTKLKKNNVPMTVVNVFTKVGDGKNTLSAKAYLAQCQVNDPKELYRLRRSEDQKVLERLGAKIIDLKETDALWRKPVKRSRMRAWLGTKFPELDRVYPTYRFHIVSGRIGRGDKVLVQKLRRKLRGI